MKEGKLTKILKSRDEIKYAIEKNKKLATRQFGSGGYVSREEDWGIYDSSLENFGKSFSVTTPINVQSESHFLSPGMIWQKYIEDTLSRKDGASLTAVEFGGPGSRLFSGFTRNFFKKTLGVCLKDIRHEIDKNEDTAHNHSIICNDILDPDNKELFTQIKAELDSEGIDLIISRMSGPLRVIKRHPAILDRIIRNWYNLLNENGLMFIQFDYSALPGEFIYPKIVEWAENIQRLHPEVEIQVERDSMRIHKTNGSPKILPPSSQLFD